MYFHLKIIAQIVPTRENLESLDVAVLFDVLRLDLADQVSDAVDVVSETQTT